MGSYRNCYRCMKGSVPTGWHKCFALIRFRIRGKDGNEWWSKWLLVERHADYKVSPAEAYRHYISQSSNTLLYAVRAALHYKDRFNRVIDFQQAVRTLTNAG